MGGVVYRVDTRVLDIDIIHRERERGAAAL